MIRAQNAITRISENDEDNAKNYMESLGYITNLYKFINHLQTVINPADVTFLPSFKGKYTVEKLGIPSTAKENEMKVFRISSKLFLEDDIKRKVCSAFREMCDDIFSLGELITFTLK